MLVNKNTTFLYVTVLEFDGLGTQELFKPGQKIIPIAKICEVYQTGCECGSGKPVTNIIMDDGTCYGIAESIQYILAVTSNCEPCTQVDTELGSCTEDERLPFDNTLTYAIGDEVTFGALCYAAVNPVAEGGSNPDESTDWEVITC